MKKLFLSFTAALLALTLAACATGELPAFNGEQQDIDITPSAPTDRAVDGEAEKPEITVNDPTAQQPNIEWECVAENPDYYNEMSTVTTISLPQAASENNVPADATSVDSINTTPAKLKDPLPTMTYASVNSAGEYEYTVQNNTQYEWGYGLEPYFDKYDEEQGVWLPVEPITEITVIKIYCILQPGGSSTYTLPIEQYYGDLSAGSYRVGLLMRNHQTEMAEMVWYEFSVGIDESYWRDIECH